LLAKEKGFQTLSLETLAIPAPLIDESCSYFSLIDYGILYKFQMS
jgi:hypothetical protein